MTTNGTALRVEHIHTAYDKADVLHDVSLVAEAGKITCILGSNGSGKSTLIRSILGLTPPRAGRILFGDIELTGLSSHRVIATGIACIPEGRKVFPKLTVAENLQVGAYQTRDAARIRVAVFGSGCSRARPLHEPPTLRRPLDEEVEPSLEDGLHVSARVGVREGILRGFELLEEALRNGDVQSAKVGGQGLARRAGMCRRRLLPLDGGAD